MSAPRIAMLLFAVGAPVLFLGEALGLQLAGTVILLAAIGAGAFAIATPDFLAGDEPGDGD